MKRSSIRNQTLENAYRFNKQSPTAYLDESYNVDPRHGERYYLMTAVVVQADQRDLVRADLIKIAQSGYWHTTEQYRSFGGRQRIQEMLDYLAHPNGSEHVVISCRSPITEYDKNGEQARKETLTQLLNYLNQGKPKCGDVNLFVLEERRGNREKNLDAATKREALKEKKISEKVRFFQITPAVEQLLWLPDLVASVYRQHLLGINKDFEGYRPERVV